MLQKFTHLTKRAKFIFFISKLSYFAFRVWVRLGSEGVKLFAAQDMMPVMGIFITFTLTIHIDDQIVWFIGSAFNKIQETEKHWFTTLQKISNGILIYNTQEQKVTF